MAVTANDQGFDKITPRELVERVKEEAISLGAGSLSTASMPNPIHLERIETTRAAIEAVLVEHKDRLEALFHVGRYPDIADRIPYDDEVMPKPYGFDLSENPEVVLARIVADQFAERPDYLHIAVSATKGLIIENQPSTPERISVDDTPNEFRMSEVNAQLAEKILSFVDKGYLASVDGFTSDLSDTIVRAYEQMTDFLSKRIPIDTGDIAGEV